MTRATNHINRDLGMTRGTPRYQYSGIGESRHTQILGYPRYRVILHPMSEYIPSSAYLGIPRYQGIPDIRGFCDIGVFPAYPISYNIYVYIYILISGNTAISAYSRYMRVYPNPEIRLSRCRGIPRYQGIPRYGNNLIL